MKAQNRRISEMTQKSYKSIYVEHEIVLEKQKTLQFRISCSILAKEKEQIKSKISRRKIIQIRAEINKNENKKSIF